MRSGSTAIRLWDSSIEISPRQPEMTRQRSGDASMRMKDPAAEKYERTLDFSMYP